MATYPQNYAQTIPQTRRYFVVVVHFGAAHLTETCVEAWLRGKKKPDEIVVIDNNPAATAWSFKDRVRVIRPLSNSGFAAAANIGLGVVYGKHPALTDVVIVVNNDLIVNYDTLADFDWWWGRQIAFGLAGVPIREASQVVFGGRLNRFSGRCHLNEEAHDRLDYIHGAWLAADYKTWTLVRGMPEKYFMYWEDVALSFIARRLKIPLALAPIGPVEHFSKSETSTQKEYYQIRNGAYFMTNETALPCRLTWRGYNKLRRLWHSGLGRKSIVAALSDAANQIMGRQNV